MSCDAYQKYELGALNQTEFDRHASSCPECQKQLEQDARLLALTRNLKQPLATPLLWAKIENSLRAEKRKRLRSRRVTFREQSWMLMRIAAVLLLTAGVGSYFLFKPQPSKSRLLAGAALAQVEQKEKEYSVAIAELEAAALPQMAKLDTDLMLLYRDRLETIDAQIERCKEALATNPANAHIRRYLLAALQDKKETLKELVELEG